MLSNFDLSTLHQLSLSSGHANFAKETNMKSTLKVITMHALLFAMATQVAAQSSLYFEAQTISKKGKKNKISTQKLHWEPQKTAIIICDMWDQHWCATATERVKEMAPRMNEAINQARQKGVTIIHAPSSTMDFYKGYPQRLPIQNAPMTESSKSIKDWYYLDTNSEDELPIDDSDGGCDDPSSDCVHCEVWTRQIETIEIADTDLISDSGPEINNYLTQHNIDQVIIMGVHTNMCVLGRPFGIRSQINLGRQVLLVRDLTDTMYNPAMHPKVDHDEGTALVIQHVEKFWCPTIDAAQLIDNEVR